VSDRSESVDDAGSGQNAKGVESRAREAHPSEDGQEQHRAGHADRKPDPHLDRELFENDRDTSAVLRRELDHSDHERDPHRVVRAGLALEDRPGSSAYLPATEDGECDRRISGSDRGADQPGSDPRNPQDVVGGERDQPPCGERAKDAKRQNGLGRSAKARKADVQPAVEEDDDQRDDSDSLDHLDRECVPE